MAYQVIARKFRPRSFAEVRGQEHISQTLQRAIETGRIHHAYLFTGARGVGKTSMARILAKQLNFPKQDDDATQKAASEIDQGINIDVREIDGASNTGVDDVRELRDEVRYLPNSSTYRIYIIDEVHMLSNNAFNALLKTLEEPPDHVIFIFATTEPHKIPDTILSRCQRYDFRLLSHQQILQQLDFICKEEKIDIQEEALHVLAQEAAGSMRDAETLLEQVISFTQDQITAEIVSQSLGLIDRTLMTNTLFAIIHRQGTELLKIVRQLHEHGHDMKYFTQSLLNQIRNLSIIKICQMEQSEPNDILDLSDLEMKTLNALAEKTSLSETQRLFRLLSSDFSEIVHAANQRISLEMSLLRLVQSPPLNEISNIIDELRTMKANGTTFTSAPASTPAKTNPRATPATKTPPENKTMDTPPAKPSGGSPWEQIIQIIKSRNMILAHSLSEAKLIHYTDQEITLGVAGSTFLYDLLNGPEAKTEIAKAGEELSGSKPSLKIQTNAEFKPLQTESQKQYEEKQHLSEELKDHPAVQDIQNILGGQIEDVKTGSSKNLK